MTLIDHLHYFKSVQAASTGSVQALISQSFVGTMDVTTSSRHAS